MQYMRNNTLPPVPIVCLELCTLAGYHELVWGDSRSKDVWSASATRACWFRQPAGQQDMMPCHLFLGRFFKAYKVLTWCGREQGRAPCRVSRTACKQGRCSSCSFQDLRCSTNVPQALVSNYEGTQS